jgi:hypothetical protein
MNNELGEDLEGSGSCPNRDNVLELAGGTEESNAKPESGYSVSQSGFVPITSPVQVRAFPLSSLSRFVGCDAV